MSTRRLAIVGGSFNPPHNRHVDLVKMISADFDRVVVIPCGPRPDKPTTNDVEPIHRAVMIDLAFRGMPPNVVVDLSDLERDTFTTNYELEARYRAEGREVTHVVGSDLIRDRDGRCPIREKWHEGEALWRGARFLVSPRVGYPVSKDDLPPHGELTRESVPVASQEIRTLVFERKPYREHVPDAVAEYIERHGLYRGRPPALVGNFRHVNPEIEHLVDCSNPRAAAASARLSAMLRDFPAAPEKDLYVVIGGDGTMLNAIRKHWRERIPVFGVNAGHLGFLMNDVADSVTYEMFSREMIVRTARLLHVSWADPKDGLQEHLAFNDIALLAPRGKSGWFTMSVAGVQRTPRLIGDGLLIATEAGSTAWARAMGALPVPIGSNLLVYAGSNIAYPLDWRNGILAADSVVTIASDDPSGYRTPYLVVDGEDLGQVSAPVTIRQSRVAAAELLFLPEHDPREKLYQAQFPRLHA